MILESYAQELEDVICYAILRDVQSGFYIDIGANDPTKFNVTKFFYLRGWHGINIDPLSDKCLLLEQERQRDINLCVGIGAKRGHMTLYERDMLSTFSETTAQSLNITNKSSAERLILTLDDIYRDYCSPAQQVHFCKIDVENYEKEVLMGWRVFFRPWLFCIESTLPTTNIPSYEEWEDILTENDYVFALSNGINRYYIDKRKAHLLKNAASAWEFLGNYEIRVLDVKRVNPSQREKTGENLESQREKTGEILEIIRSLLNNENNILARNKVLLSLMDRISQGGNVVIARSDEMCQLHRRMLSILRPYNVVGCEKIRIGASNVGGYVMLDPGKKGLAYSFGCHWFFPFDKDLADRNFKVYEYDGKYPTAPGKHPNIVFSPVDPTTRQEAKTGYKTLDSIFTENGYGGEYSMILQANLCAQDGWDFFEHITEEQLCRFDQIVATFYELDNLERLRAALQIFEKMQNTHQCIHFHYHNYGDILCYWDFLVSGGIELTFVRRDNHRFEPSTDEYPTVLDAPTVARYPDVYIGNFADITVTNEDDSKKCQWAC